MAREARHAQRGKFCLAAPIAKHEGGNEDGVGNDTVLMSSFFLLQMIPVIEIYQPRA